MIYTPIDPSTTRLSSESVLSEAARCWKRARDAGMETTPLLHTLLSSRGREMLAPTFNSLMSLIEERLSRPFATGHSAEASADERMLAELVQRARDIATPFACALWSTRIMLDDIR